MPGIYTMMDISRWALQASTAHLDTISHNVANVNTPGYSRQSIVQATRPPELTREGWYGNGVEVVNVVQHVDRLLLARITDKTSTMNYQDSRLAQLRRLESLANEAGDTSLGEEVTAFFSAWEAVSNNPESSAVRRALTDKAQNLINRFQTLHGDLRNIENDLDVYIKGAVQEANGICRRIAELNSQIVASENTNRTANDFRDERQRQLEKLSELMDIQWFEDVDGYVTVFGGQGKTLVQVNYPKEGDDPLAFMPVDGEDRYQVVWQGVEDMAMNDNEISGGKLGAWLKVRDEDLPDMRDFLDKLAKNLISEVNKLHTQGAGLDKFTSVTGTYQGLGPNEPINNTSGEPPYGDLLQDGTLTMWVYEGGTRTKHEISVTADETMDSLATKINDAIDPVNRNFASVDSDNKFSLNASPGQEFLFAGDTSNVLTALGVNTFFTGDSVSNISLNPTVASNVRNVAAGRVLADGEHAAGDKKNALDLADLKDVETMENQDSVIKSDTFNESIIAWASSLGTEVASTEDNLKYAATATSELLDQRDSVSAVNLDEEMVKMVQQQRSYQMAAKLVTVADTLLATVLDMKR
jgi:flagellar hook-associated protein 1 FlgK